MKKLSLLAIGFMITGLFACVDQDFDTPPEPAPCDEANTTIAELKASLGGLAKMVVEDDVVISGVVVADDKSGNFYQEVVLQDETGGILIGISAVEVYVRYPVGRRLTVSCKGLELENFSGAIQIGSVPWLTRKDFICVGDIETVPTPKTVTVNDLDNADIFSLVQLENVQFALSAAGAPFADAINSISVNHILDECATGENITVRTSGFADFAGDLTPTGNGTIVGIYNVFGGTKQLFLRDLDDVADMTRERCLLGVVSTLSQDFDSFNNNEDILINAWSNLAVKGSRLWRAQEFGGNLYAQATAFGDQSPEMESWLITPGIDLSEPKTLRFESAMAFFDHDALTVMISTDWNGSSASLASATWIDLQPNLATSSTGDNTWVPSGDVALSGYSGIGYIAFRYIGSGPDGLDTSFRIDNLEVVNQ